MKRIVRRDGQICKLSLANPWYQYEKEKKRLSLHDRETEVKKLVRSLQL